MIKALENVFERKNPLTKMFIMKRLLKLKFTSGELQDHFVQVETYKLDDSYKACFLLLTMPDRYKTVITALGTMTTELTFDFVKSRLLDAEMKFNESSRSHKRPDNFSFTAKKVSQGCYECGDQSHFRRDSPESQQPSFYKDTQAQTRGKGRAEHGHKGDKRKDETEHT
jgi:hypothetical protein